VVKEHKRQASNGKPATVNPKCPDFDDDCFGVEDKHICWLGMPPTYIEDIGEVIWTPMAKGYCPFLRGL
jgi:hypothetical protein